MGFGNHNLASTLFYSSLIQFIYNITTQSNEKTCASPALFNLPLNHSSSSFNSVASLAPISVPVFVAPTPQLDPYWNTLLAKYDDGGLSGINDWLEDMEKRKPSSKHQPGHDGEEAAEKEFEVRFFEDWPLIR